MFFDNISVHSVQGIFFLKYFSKCSVIQDLVKYFVKYFWQIIERLRCLFTIVTNSTIHH